MLSILIIFGEAPDHPSRSCCSQSWFTASFKTFNSGLVAGASSHQVPAVEAAPDQVEEDGSLSALRLRLKTFLGEFRVILELQS